MVERLTWEDAVRWLLEQPHLQHVVRDCYYDRPPRAAAERYAASAEWAAVRPLLGDRRGRAVDLGAGHGITCVALAREGFHVTAVEPDRSDLVGRGAIARLADELSLHVEALDGTAETIPVPDDSFDVALAREVLHHTRDLPRACREIYRVLRPGGRFLSLRDHVISSRSDLPRFLESHALHRLYGGENAFLEREYLEAVRAAGFLVERRLRSFDSVINFAPHSRDGLRQAFASRVGRIPLAATTVSALLSPEWVFDRFLSVMSTIDWRPGRLLSLVCRKPGGGCD